LATLCAQEGLTDLRRGSLTVRRQSEVPPVDQVGRPRRLPTSVQIETEVTGRVVLDAVGDRRGSNPCPVGQRDVPLGEDRGAPAPVAATSPEPGLVARRSWL